MKFQDQLRLRVVLLHLTFSDFHLSLELSDRIRPAPETGQSG